MSHIFTHRRDLLSRVNRLTGQLNGLKRALEEGETDEDCRAIMGQMASIRGATNGLLMVFVEEHLRQHVALGNTRDERNVAAEELISALRSYRV